MKKNKTYLNLDELGTAIGLTTLDKELVRQKNRLIDYLKKVRLEEGISQQNLAKRLGTKQPAIARMESGYVGEVSFDFLIRVGLALRVPLEITPSRKAA